MQMLDFRTLLVESGLNPTEVNLLRHCPDGIVDPFAAWKKDRQAFEAYQQFQKVSQRSYFSRPIWAAFAPDRRGRTFFVVLYDAALSGALSDGERDPLTNENFNSATAERYLCSRRPELSDYVGRLVVDWGAGTRAWGQKGTASKPILELLRVVEEPAFPARRLPAHLPPDEGAVCRQGRWIRRFLGPLGQLRHDGRRRECQAQEPRTKRLSSVHP